MANNRRLPAYGELRRGHSKHLPVKESSEMTQARFGLRNDKRELRQSVDVASEVAMWKAYGSVNGDSDAIDEYLTRAFGQDGCQYREDELYFEELNYGVDGTKLLPRNGVSDDE